jgi:beta-lactam-binding protein with PASTA domain
LLLIGGLLAWYFLTRGSDKATVPNVIGLRADVAAARIHDKGLDVSPCTGASDRPPNIVFGEKPGPETQLHKSQTVTIFISSGRKPVPGVKGLPVAQAQTQLTSAGFKVEIKHIASSRPKGTVVDQQPVAGVTAVAGTIVTLSVSSGATPVIVPRVASRRPMPAPR